MNSTLRVRIKKNFDYVVYTYPRVNWALRNLNKFLAGLTTFRLRPFGILNVRLSSGLQFKMATNETSTVTKKLFWNGADNYEYSAIFLDVVQHARVFFDVGASIGYYSLLAAKANPSISVVAFEPASSPFHFLKKNVAINNLNSQITTSPVALSDAEGNLQFHEFRTTINGVLKHNLGGAGSLKINFDSQRMHTVAVTVAASTLDSFCENNHLPLPDLIKMDTEGTEDMVLRGAHNVLQNQPLIICETLFNTTEQKLEDILKHYGYRYFNFVNGILTEVTTLARSEDNGVRDCFFVPESKIPWIAHFVKKN
jgi:FkbM family methyltransferase